MRLVAQCKRAGFLTQRQGWEIPRRLKFSFLSGVAFGLAICASVQLRNMGTGV